MTITMANLHRRPVAAAVGLALLSLAPACRADWKFTPQVEVRETYTDNVALRPNGEGNWVTELAPSLRIAHTGPRLQLDATIRGVFLNMRTKMSAASWARRKT